MACLLTGHLVVRLTNSTDSLILELPQGDKLHNFLAELKRTKQSMYSAWRYNYFTTTYTGIPEVLVV